MIPFHKQFKDRIDGSDGSVVLKLSEYLQIQEEAARCILEECVDYFSQDAFYSESAESGRVGIEVHKFLARRFP